MSFVNSSWDDTYACSTGDVPLTYFKFHLTFLKFFYLCTDLKTCTFVIVKVKHTNYSIMEHLVIISPKGGAFAADLSRFPHVYKKTAESAYFAYFTYVGVMSAKQKVLQVLSIHNFTDFSLDKETNHLRLKVNVE